MTLSDVFAVDSAAATPRKSPAAPAGGAQAHARMRARGPIVHRVTTAAGVVWGDLLDCWWTPASLPTLEQAWADRTPDIARVPGENPALHRAWVAYNHTLGLLVPALAVLLVGALTPLIWISRHPARLLLAIALLVPLIATTVALT